MDQKVKASLMEQYYYQVSIKVLCYCQEREFGNEKKKCVNQTTSSIESDEWDKVLGSW